MRRHSREYREVLESERWATLRAVVLRRARHRCQSCGRRARQAGCPMDVHHAQGYARLGAETLDELHVLCRYPCHQLAHGRRGYGRFGWRRLRLRGRARLLVLLGAVVLVLLLGVHPT